MSLGTHILTDNSLKLSSDVTVVQTKLGYTVIEKTNTIDNSLCNNVVSLHCANFTVTDLRNLDAIGITDPTEDAKRKHAHFDFLNQFKENLSVLPDGRYQLPLPFKFKTQLPNNKSATFKRHQRICQRMDEQNLLNEYEVVFRQWEDLQIIEEVPKTEVDNFGYYLPHRPVMKQASRTMKIRPVFDASARDKSQPSLNDCLNRGPNLIELIPDIIDRFRLYPIGLSHCRVVFGICSPFQLSACIDHLLENSPARFDDVTQKLKHSFYVDSCVTGVTDIKEQESFINKAIEGIKRVKTRITERSDHPEFIYPIILPGECLFTQRLIEYYHRQNCHAGTQILLGILRERFWIVRSRRVVRKIVRSCIRCKRYKCKSPNSEPVSLPRDRVNDAAVFEVVSVDLAGPLYVKGGQKSWIDLFTCATYRAVHLELTSSLSTDAFLLSLRRFIARRGDHE
ncbi:putative RNA-directed DNA polymerase from transposon X-element [Trichonephila clavipes]|nr:putative RNA-directed DNA polymerase from transposon X-element [Trichonephila clavipes]